MKDNLVDYDLEEVNIDDLVTTTLKIYYQKVGQHTLEKLIDKRVVSLVEAVACKVLKDSEIQKYDYISKRIEQGVSQSVNRFRP